MVTIASVVLLVAWGMVTAICVHMQAKELNENQKLIAILKQERNAYQSDNVLLKDENEKLAKAMATIRNAARTVS